MNSLSQAAPHLPGPQFPLNKQKLVTLNQSLTYNGKQESYRLKDRKKRKMQSIDASRFLK